MASAIPASLLAHLRQWQLDGDNRLAVEGMSAGVDDSGALTLSIRQVQAAALRLAGSILPALGASAEWTLEPLAAAEGMLQAQITDAHLMFDADVKVPVRAGQIDFDEATVAHVGPDSRMGVSRLGVYVDAPNGRSYLYQFSAAPVGGIEFEKRGALLSPWATHRGRIALRPFAEGLLRQGAGSATQGVTAQSRVLLDRTTLSGHLQLGDGRVSGPGLQAELVGAAQHRNLLRLQSPAAARVLKVEIEALSLRNVVCDARGVQLRGDEVSGALGLQLQLEGSRLQVTLDAAELRVLGVRVTQASA
jgi:hypothetical protein